MICILEARKKARIAVRHKMLPISCDGTVSRKLSPFGTNIVMYRYKNGYGWS